MYSYHYAPWCMLWFVLFYSTESHLNETQPLNETDTNATNQDLLVVKTVVYEVGILTDADDNITFPESNERIDVTFFNPDRNIDLLANLSKLPTPIQTNFSQLTLTDLVPIAKLNATDDILRPSNASLLQNIVFGQVRNISTNDTEEMKEIMDDIKELEAVSPIEDGFI